MEDKWRVQTRLKGHTRRLQAKKNRDKAKWVHGVSLSVSYSVPAADVAQGHQEASNRVVQLHFPEVFALVLEAHRHHPLAVPRRVPAAGDTQKLFVASNGISSNAKSATDS